MPFGLSSWTQKVTLPFPKGYFFNMAKDPAFLFYYQDFIVGTTFLTLEECGAYIRILCYMADMGHMSKTQIEKITGSLGFTNSLRSKFKVDLNSNFYNDRLDIEIEKRKSFCESRRSNRMSNICQSSVGHMENENENRNVIKKENKIKEYNILNKNKFNFEEVWLKYPKRVGKKEAIKHFHASVKTNDDFLNINRALENYIKSESVHNGYVQNGSTWFNNWRDWIDYKEPTKGGLSELPENLKHLAS